VTESFRGDIRDALTVSLPDAPWPKHSIAHLRQAEAAQELADWAVAMVPTGPHRTDSDAVGVEEVLKLRWLTDRAIAATVVATRHDASWEAIGEAAEITRQSAHARWADAVKEFDAAYHEEVRRHAYGGPGPGIGESRWDNTAERSRRLDEWVTQRRDRASSDKGPTPVSDRVTRMSLWEELAHQTRLSGVLLDDHIAPPPDLMLPITLRLADLTDAMAALTDGDQATELRREAADHRARARELHTRITTTTLDEATHQPTSLP